jgi:hypothetical protein
MTKVLGSLEELKKKHLDDKKSTKEPEFQGSILHDSILDKKISDKFSSINFGQKQRRYISVSEYYGQ